ncbi:MAG: phosphoribulokinase, partial [Rhodospirillales bacterium]|nr:phosphoribulokinase [Rhodospirillales bacterium]
EILGPDRVINFRTDDYHKFTRAERAKNGMSPLDPAANYIDVAGQHLRLLRDGQPVLKPVYDHRRGTLEAPQYVEPREYIIVEGMLGYTTRDLRNCFDVKVFLEPAGELRKKWKVKRDCSERGYTPEQALAMIGKLHEDSLEYVVPQRTFGDIIVRFYPPDGQSDESGAHLAVRHTLRPTLPHPDLTPVLDAGAKSGIHLELQRDIDGKPVDVLEIPGEIDDRRAKAVEDLLWNLIPEAAHLRDNVGRFTDDQDRQAMSHPLALSQLLIAYHMVKAALGHHAI